MIIRVSFMIVASVAAIRISRTKTSSSTRKKGTLKCSGSDGSLLEQEFEEGENSTVKVNNKVRQNEEKEINFEMPKNLLTGEFKDLELLLGDEKMYNLTVKDIVQNLVPNYKRREAKLEKKLLELNGLREKQSAIAQMQKQLEEKTEKVDFLEKTIASFRSDSEIMREKIRDDQMSKKQLDIAKKMIDEIQRKKGDAGPVREQILMLQQQVTEFKKFQSSGENSSTNKRLKDVQDIEVEVLELKRKNKELELEKRETKVKLATAQARIRTEEQKRSRLEEEIAGLQHVHEELSELVETLQRNRFDMVEEVVYQRWLYTLLRFEIQDNQRQSRKASRRDCNKNSRKELCEKKHASTSDTIDLELESVSSSVTLDESDEIETTTFASSSSSQSSDSSMKMKGWRKTKDRCNKISSKGRNLGSSPGLIRRLSFSMSNIGSYVSKAVNSGNTPVMTLLQNVNSNTTSKLLENPIIAKKNRVSFSDSVKLSTNSDIAELVESAEDEKEKISGKTVELTSKVNSINIDSIEENESARKTVVHSDEVYSRKEAISSVYVRVKIIMVYLVAFLFFSLILLACVWIR
ncbi:protein CHUP1, chloroplastic isoform X2 [Vigna radiata var. radiata]|uniref:Protein CHUP1, chloroplastic isoform X2 n=1 Tax=Vigna radiata var. radiata TaxID=3916 RepID=A0A3Q0EVY2_VIGRR|nr:protein CHUP1, chloroplastic isoform X2 [Vigna radiata var. radiata]